MYHKGSKVLNEKKCGRLSLIYLLIFQGRELSWSQHGYYVQSAVKSGVQVCQRPKTDG